MQFSDLTLRGCSSILKTVIPRLTAADNERAIGKLTAGDSSNEVAKAFGVHSSTISCPRFHTTETTRDTRGGHTLLRMKSSTKVRTNFLVIKNETTLHQGY